jgi:hypothetical protein
MDDDSENTGKHFFLRERGEYSEKIDRDNSGTGNWPLQEVTTKKISVHFLYTNASIPNPLCEISNVPIITRGTIRHIFGQQEVRSAQTWSNQTHFTFLRSAQFSFKLETTKY